MHALQKKPSLCLVSEWLKTDLTQGDIFIELIHNFIGVVANWFNTILPYLIARSENRILPLSPNLPIPEKRAYLQECFRYLSPAHYTTSFVKNPNILKQNYPPEIKDKIKDDGYYVHLYDLKNVNYKKEFWGEDSNIFNPSRFGSPEELDKKIKESVNNSTDKSFKCQSINQRDTSSKNNMNRCPFLTSQRMATVFKDQPIYEKDGYLPFGDGYRRCPGEFLSMIFLEEIALIIGDKKVTIYLKDNETKPAKYIWGLIETNYQVYIS